VHIPAIPDLVTPRLSLRGVTPADIPAIQRQFADYEVIRELTAAVPWPYPADGAANFVRNALAEQGVGRWVWGLFLRAAPEALIGVIDLRRDGAGENRGFWLARPFWGQGLMTEAAEAVTGHAFSALGFETLIFTNARGNLRSRRIKEKSGAMLLRTEPAGFVDPAYTEQEVWELTRTAWTTRNG
jgi:RimJ/RimL family protein N-acetyltransferase